VFTKIHNKDSLPIGTAATVVYVGKIDLLFQAVLKIENGLLLNNPLLVDTFLMVGAFLLCRILLVELDRRKFINPVVLYIARYIR